jgi:hypothetical protein
VTVDTINDSLRESISTQNDLENKDVLLSTNDLKALGKQGKLVDKKITDKEFKSRYGNEVLKK